MLTTLLSLLRREERVLGDQRAQQRGQEQLLALDAAVVAVGLGGDLTGAHVLQRGVAVDDLPSGVGQHGAQLVVLQRRGAAHLDAAERVDHLGEAGEVDRHEPVDGQTGQLLDHLHQTLRAADGVGGVQLGLGVDLVGSVALGVLVVSGPYSPVSGFHGSHLHRRDGQVAREGHGDNAFAVGRDVHQHDGVRARACGVVGGARAHVAVLRRSGCRRRRSGSSRRRTARWGRGCRASSGRAPRPCSGCCSSPTATATPRRSAASARTAISAAATRPTTIAVRLRVTRPGRAAGPRGADARWGPPRVRQDGQLRVEPVEPGKHLGGGIAVSAGPTWGSE